MSSINDSDKFEIPNNEPVLSSQLILKIKFRPFPHPFDHIIPHMRAQQSDGDRGPHVRASVNQLQREEAKRTFLVPPFLYLNFRPPPYLYGAKPTPNSFGANYFHPLME
jgi:hypothetical protein